MAASGQTPVEMPKMARGSLDIQHVEVSDQKHEAGDGTVTFEVDQAALPPGYFTSSFFLGTMTAIGLGLFAGVAGFAYAAPILTIINADIGPDPNYSWIALSYTLTSAVTLTIIGRISDIFGRRWVFIGGAALGLIGSIVCATAHSIPTFIGGMTIIGIGAATQLSYYYVMGELVPMKYRLAGNGFCYMFCVPGSGLAPVIARAFILYQPTVGWRGPYYLLIGVNFLALACWVLFYHPPTFHMKHPQEQAKQYIKNFDYVGTVLYTGGLLVFLMGLNWGGSVYPWASANVIATIVVGFAAMAIFVLWESFMKLKEPLMPMTLFLNRDWVVATVVSGLGASMYYAFAIVWPQMVANLYTEGDAMAAAGLATLSSISITLGEVFGGLLSKMIGRITLQCTVTLIIGGIMYACMATCTPDTKSLAAALMFLGNFFVGWAEGLAISAVTITASNQNELGTASGTAGSIRFLISSIATTVYSVILSNRLTQTTAAEVPPALTAAGLPASSIPKFITAIASSNFTNVPGVTPQIIDVGLAAYKQANSDAFRTVFLTTIAFTGIAVLASLMLPNIDNLLSGKVAITLQREETKLAKNPEA